MSTANDAWQEWEAEHYGARGANAETQRLFKSAYRRALEDAAKDCVDNWEPVYYEGKNAEWPNDTTHKSSRHHPRRTHHRPPMPHKTLRKPSTPGSRNPS